MKTQRHNETLGFSVSQHVQDMFLHYLRHGARTYSFEFMVPGHRTQPLDQLFFTVSVYRKLAEGRVIIAGITELCPVIGFDLNAIMSKLTYLGRVAEEERVELEMRLRKLIVQLHSVVQSSSQRGAL